MRDANAFLVGSITAPFVYNGASGQVLGTAFDTLTGTAKPYETIVAINVISLQGTFQPWISHSAGVLTNGVMVPSTFWQTLAYSGQQDIETTGIYHIRFGSADEFIRLDFNIANVSTSGSSSAVLSSSSSGGALSSSSGGTAPLAQVTFTAYIVPTTP